MSKALSGASPKASARFSGTRSVSLWKLPSDPRNSPGRRRVLPNSLELSRDVSSCLELSRAVSSCLELSRA
eukprot:12543793-Alexandrium_andersonii.AAC.1